MNVGLGFNPAAFARTAPSQSQVNAQVAVAGGSAATQAQDKMVKDKQRAAAMKAIGGKVSQKKVTDKAGVTKVAGAKKR